MIAKHFDVVFYNNSLKCFESLRPWNCWWKIGYRFFLLRKNAVIGDDPTASAVLSFCFVFPMEFANKKLAISQIGSQPVRKMRFDGKSISSALRWSPRTSRCVHEVYLKLAICLIAELFSAFKIHVFFCKLFVLNWRRRQRKARYKISEAVYRVTAVFCSQLPLNSNLNRKAVDPK